MERFHESTHDWSGFNKISEYRPVTLLKQNSTAAVFQRTFQNLQSNYSVVCELFCCFCNKSIFHRYLHYFPIHFHLNHSKSHSWSRVYVIIGIYYLVAFSLFYMHDSLITARLLTHSSHLTDLMNFSSQLANNQSRRSQVTYCNGRISQTHSSPIAFRITHLLK